MAQLGISNAVQNDSAGAGSGFWFTGALLVVSLTKHR